MTWIVQSPFYKNINLIFCYKKMTGYDKHLDLEHLIFVRYLNYIVRMLLCPYLLTSASDRNVLFWLNYVFLTYLNDIQSC